MSSPVPDQSLTSLAEAPSPQATAAELSRNRTPTVVKTHVQTRCFCPVGQFSVFCTPFPKAELGKLHRCRVNFEFALQDTVKHSFTKRLDWNNLKRLILRATG